MGKGRGFKRIGTRRGQYCGPAEEKMAAMHRRSEAENLEDMRQQLLKERQEVEKKKKERKEWEMQQELEAKEQEVKRLKHKISEA